MKAHIRLERGYTLIEVLVGMTIFALGMMALAHLQTNISKSSADSNARTVAINIAEEEIEAVRSFSQLTASTDPNVDAFEDIGNGTSTKSVPRGGIDYTVTSTVTNYYYNPDSGEFQINKSNPDALHADLKRLELNVAWGAGQSFQIDDSNSTTGLGTGSITMVDLISSFTTGTKAKVVMNNAVGGLYAPPVDYNPGQNPDIVSIRLGNNKFKESTTPLPDVIRTNEIVETRFDVVTYSQNNLGSTFLRREEFRAVSCECQLHTSTSSTEGGKRPTIWDGTEYTEGEYVAKAYGTSASNQQSIYCGICCRDHHDGGSGSNDDPNDPGRAKYNPFRSSDDYFADGPFPGDHKHYNRNRLGELVLAENDGDRYVEACRLVRKNGFFRVAQDLRQEGLNAFPGGYLDDSSELDTYSGYVTGAVSAYEADVGATDGYEQSPPSLTAPGDMVPAVVFPASTYDNATQMSDTSNTVQQLRTRGVYLDYLSDALRTKINCLDMGGSGSACDTPDVTSALEIMPFYDVQLTWLARWNETPNNNPIDVTNEAIADDNTHSRGLASLQSGFGYSTVSSKAHKGNLGLTGTDPIDPWYTADEAEYDLYALAVDYTSPPPLSGVVISGTITSAVPGLKAADVEITASGAQCDRTNTGFECVLETGASNPTLKIYNYDKPNTNLIGCSVNGNLFFKGAEVSTNRWTSFYLPSTETLNADIVLRQDSC